MPQRWDADIEFSEELAGTLIARQFPELSPVHIEPLGSGWDNSAYLVNERFVFRFPRRRVAARFIDNEIRILPLLSPYLPLPIPVPAFMGMPTDEYPYPYLGCEHVDGATACRVSLSDEERAKNAAPLALFLMELHRIPVPPDTRAWAPGDELKRADIKMRSPQLKEWILGISILVPDLDVSQCLGLLDRLAETPLSASLPCWVHGDLYARHLLLDNLKCFCGVIDWGDVHLGDPALDLSIAFSFLPPAARGIFRESYGVIDEDTWNRAQFRALTYGAILLNYGTDIGDKAIRKAGEYALLSASKEI